MIRTTFLALLGLLIPHAQAREPANPKTPSAVRIVAHRGLIHHAPENTPASFAACLHLNLGFELDVQRSADGHLVCIHDSTLDRTTSGKGKVADLSLEQLRKLDAGSWLDHAFAGERIPTLDEVFALIARHPHASSLIAVDIKLDDPSVEADIARLAEKHGVLKRLICIGRTITAPEVRARLRKASADIPIAVLAADPAEVPQRLKDPQASWIYVRFIPTSDLVDQIHRQGKKVFIAGPMVSGREVSSWKKVRDAGVDALLTDYPLQCRQELRAGKAP